jgi:fatty-acyl-CoA synthase
VTGIPHGKCAERPLLVIVPREGTRPDRDTARPCLDRRVARWLPDDVVLANDLPRTATGRLGKLALRRGFATCRGPADATPA